MSVLGNVTVDRAAAYRTPAYMGLGNVFQNPIRDFNEMMRISTLDQLVITEEFITPVGGDARFIVPVKAFIGTDVTTGERKVLGIVGEERTLFQPVELLGTLQNLGPGMSWEIAGTLRDDRTVFGAIRWEHESKIGDESVMQFMCIAAAFDGTMPLTGFMTPIRPECGNTITAGMKTASQSFKIRQTKNARDRLVIATDAFAKANAYVSVWEKAMQEMVATDFSDQRFENLITRFYPKPKTEAKGNMTKWEDKRDAHYAMWNADHNANIRGTAYGAFNVLCEVQQWGRQERGGQKGNEAFYLAGAGFDTVTEKFRTDVFNRVRDVTGLATV